jgi:hypothetical protein
MATPTVTRAPRGGNRVFCRPDLRACCRIIRSRHAMASERSSAYSKGGNDLNGSHIRCP